MSLRATQRWRQPARCRTKPRRTRAPSHPGRATTQKRECPDGTTRLSAQMKLRQTINEKLLSKVGDCRVIHFFDMMRVAHGDIQRDNDVSAIDPNVLAMVEMHEAAPVEYRDSHCQ